MRAKLQEEFGLRETDEPNLNQAICISVVRGARRAKDVNNLMFRYSMRDQDSLDNLREAFRTC